jgi:hypothetical protein
MDEVLVDRRELLAERFIELSYHFVVTAHATSLRDPRTTHDAIVRVCAMPDQAQRATGPDIASETQSQS